MAQYRRKACPLRHGRYAYRFSNPRKSNGVGYHKSIVSLFLVSDTVAFPWLRARVGIGADLKVIEDVGCAGMEVAVDCLGNRIVKLDRVELRAVGVDLLPRFQEAFGNDFGHIPTHDGDHPPFFSVELLRISDHDLPRGCVLERDDVCKFFLPIQSPGFHIFSTVESESVRLVAVQFNQEEIELARGLEIQRCIKNVIDAWGDKIQTLKKPVACRVYAISQVMPDPSAAGTLNPKPLNLGSNFVPGTNVSPQQPSRIDFALDCTVKIGLRADESGTARHPSIIACFQTHADRFDHSMDLPVAHQLAVNILAAFYQLGHVEFEKALTALGVEIHDAAHHPPPPDPPGD